MKNFIALLFISANLFAQNNDSTIEKFFRGHTGVFVMYDSLNGKYFMYNEQRCGEFFLPASTFKIPIQ